MASTAALARLAILGLALVTALQLVHASMEAHDPGFVGVMPEEVPSVTDLSPESAHGFNGTSYGRTYGYGGYGYGSYYGSASGSPYEAGAQAYPDVTSQRDGALDGPITSVSGAAARKLHHAHLVPADESTMAPDGSRPVARSLISVNAGQTALMMVNADQTVPQQDARQGLSKPCTPCPACSEIASSNGKPARGGSADSCYCRFDAAAGAWELREPTCRMALYEKCGPQGSLLECAAVESHFSSPAASAPHADRLSDFLFTDCPPSPPCGCAAAVLAGGARGPGMPQCCQELRAHCMAPFSGLDCGDVEDLCSASGPGTATLAVRQFVAVRSHKEACPGPPALRQGEPSRAGGAAAERASQDAVFWGDRAARALRVAAEELVLARGIWGCAVLLLVGMACGAVPAAAVFLAACASKRWCQQQGTRPQFITC